MKKLCVEKDDWQDWVSKRLFLEMKGYRFTFVKSQITNADGSASREGGIKSNAQFSKILNQDRVT